MAKLKQFEVTARLVLVCGLTITAQNIEDAIEQARGLTAHDFVKFLGDSHDSSIAITAITKPNSWNTNQQEGL